MCDLIQFEAAYSSLQIVAQRSALADIEHVEYRLLGEKHKASDQLLLLGRHLQLAQRLLLFESLFRAQQQSLFVLKIVGAPFLEIFFQALQTLFHLGQVADHQIEFDVLDIAKGIDGANVRNRFVFEGAQYVNQCVHIAQAGQEAVSFSASCPMAATSTNSTDA